MTKKEANESDELISNALALFDRHQSDHTSSKLDIEVVLFTQILVLVNACFLNLPQTDNQFPLPRRRFLCIPKYGAYLYSQC